MKKSIITFIVFTLTTFAFSYETKAFAKALLIEQPAADSCYEITLKNGQKIYANILEIGVNTIKYRPCGYEEVSKTLIIEKSEMIDIKTVTEEKGENEIYKNSKKEQNKNQTKLIYILYALSLLSFLLISRIGFNFYIIGFLLFLYIVFSILTLVNIIRYKEKFQGKIIFGLLSILQIIFGFLLIGLYFLDVF